MPSYITAWLSLKTKDGKNLDIADLIESVFIEEMTHMTLGANILNAIGGKPDLTSFRNIPSYPTALGFGAIYQLGQEMMATIEPMSIGLASDIFSKIEEPQMEKQRDLFECVALIAKILEDDSPISYRSKRQNIVKKFIEEFYPQKSRYTTELCGLPVPSEDDTWTKIKIISTFALKQLILTELSSIGAFYGFVSLEVSLLESCLQLGLKTRKAGNYSCAALASNEAQNTLFTGSGDNQVMWPERDIIKVEDLYTALTAILTIVYQGEGGSKCSPYVGEDGTKELSHYYRFQEIVKGRKLIEVQEGMEVPTDLCLNLDKDCQPASRRASTGVKFCYLGDLVTLNEDGIWPIVSSPDVRKYKKNSMADIVNKRFNVVYSDMIQCLHTTLNGKPGELGICISKMHDLVIEGKRVVQTKITEGEYAGKNVAPTWSYIRPLSDTAGLPLV